MDVNAEISLFMIVKIKQVQKYVRVKVPAIKTSRIQSQILERIFH